MKGRMISNIKELVPLIDDVCSKMELRYDDSVRRLILGTAAAESHLIMRRQLGSGPARGLWQMEPSTGHSLYNDFLRYRPTLYALLSKLVGLPGKFMVPSKVEIGNRLEKDDYYACALARLRYAWDKYSIPDDMTNIAKYYKRVYNTILGKGSPEKFLDDWDTFGCEDLLIDAGD